MELPTLWSRGEGWYTYPGNCRADRRAPGVAGATRRGSHAGKHGRPLGMLFRAATDGYKGDRNSIGSVRESELPIVPLVLQGQHNLGRGKGQCLHRVFEGGKEMEIAKC